MEAASELEKENHDRDNLTRVFMAHTSDNWLGNWVTANSVTGILFLHIDFAYAYRKKWGQGL
jgi:hypothetical protein